MTTKLSIIFIKNDLLNGIAFARYLKYNKIILNCKITIIFANTWLDEVGMILRH